MAEEFQNPFEELDQKLRDVPPEMRKKVMNDVAIAKFVLEMATLFTTNIASALQGLLKTNKRTNKQPKN